MNCFMSSVKASTALVNPKLFSIVSEFFLHGDETFLKYRAKEPNSMLKNFTFGFGLQL